MIFKLQRSLYDGGQTVLAYNKERSIQGQFPCTKKLAKIFDREESEKVYAMCDIRGQQIVVLMVMHEQLEW